MSKHRPWVMAIGILVLIFVGVPIIGALSSFVVAGMLDLLRGHGEPGRSGSPLSAQQNGAFLGLLFGGRACGLRAMRLGR